MNDINNSTDKQRDNSIYRIKYIYSKYVRPLNMGAYGMSIVLLMLYKKLYIYKPVETGVTG